MRAEERPDLDDSDEFYAQQLTGQRDVAPVCACRLLMRAEERPDLDDSDEFYAQQLTGHRDVAPVCVQAAHAG